MLSGIAPRIFLLTLLTIGCTEEVKQSDANKETAAGEQTTTGTSETNTVYAEALYASFDGTNDYSLLLLGENTVYTVKDSSVAIIEDAEINVTTENLDALLQKNFATFKSRIENLCKENPDSRQCSEPQTFETYKERFSSTFRVQKVVPLKAGVTTLTSSRRPGGGGGGASATINLVVTGFSPDDYEAGKTRYNTLGEGNLKACASCHLSGNENAPPHALGRVKGFSDLAIRTWVTTGQYDGIKAAITHTWEFAADQQKTGIVPYLRSLQSKDVNSLMEQYIAELDGTFEDGIGGSN